MELIYDFKVFRNIFVNYVYILFLFKLYDYVFHVWIFFNVVQIKQTSLLYLKRIKSSYIFCFASHRLSNETINRLSQETLKL